METISLNKLFTQVELNKIIKNGIKTGVERANDEGLIFNINYSTLNGNNAEAYDYTNRLMNDSLNDKDNSIINKYKELK